MSETNQQPDSRLRRQRERLWKWIFCVFPAALFATALFYRAPWKVTAITALVFARAVGLIPCPPAWRKWFWRCLLTSPVVFCIWVFLPSSPGSHKPFMFVQERARLESDYPVPSDRDASVLYNQLVEQHDPHDRDLPPWKSEPDEVVRRHLWKSDDYPEAARWLDERAATIEALKGLAEHSHCRFPRRLALQLHQDELSYPRQNIVPYWTRTLTCAANRSAGDGDIAAALQTHALTLKIAAHHIQQFEMADYLIGLATERLVFRAIRAIAVDGAPSADELAIMNAMVAAPSHDWTSTWQRIVRSECLLAKDTLCSHVYEINAQGRIRYSRTLYPDLKEIESPRARSRSGKFFVPGLWLLLPESPWRCARRIDERFAYIAQLGQPGTAATSPHTRPPYRFRANHEYFLDKLIDILEPAYFKVHETCFGKNEASRRACRIILRLRRHKDETGQWPDSPNDLPVDDPKFWTDPLSGDPFVYQKTPDGFRLYSKGPNRIDENAADDTDDFLLWAPPENQ